MTQTQSQQKRISLVEHLQKGQQLYAASTDATRLAVNLSRACGRQHKATQAARKAARALNDLRYELEALMFRDFSELPDNAIQIYYPSGGLCPTSQEAAQAVSDAIQNRFDYGTDADDETELFEDAIFGLFETYTIHDICRGLADFKIKHNLK